MEKETITKKIRRAGKTLGVSRHEICDEMIKFYRVNDRKGMKELFEAYRNWEIREMTGKETLEETTLRAKENFDCVARIGDGLLLERPLFSSMVTAISAPKTALGQLSRFYRETVDYQPVDESSN